jgi:hypothetical protein
VRNTLLTAGLFAIASAAGTASATTYTWNYNVSGANNAAGTFESIQASFDDASNRFTWNVIFSDRVTNGYTLAVSPGANPKGHPGELALIYFDGSTSFASPTVSVYNYNGQNLLNSFNDGDGTTPGAQAPDIIHSGTTPGASASDWLIGASISDIAGGKRQISLDIDATIINSHVPVYPGSSPWTGVEFAQKLGLWFHTFTGLNTSYDANGNLTSWGFSKQGWIDGANFDTTVLVPLPAPVLTGAIGLGMVGLIARRRKNK